jgi:threonylcarbamoyladenosine tRNA methylthiotransferase CDKAL1
MSLEIYFETYGCTANYNSTEIMKGLVKQAGLNITSNPDFADLIVINSCIVKEPTEEKIRRRIQDLLKQKKKIILAGCMPRLNKEKLNKKNLFLLDTSHIKNIIHLIEDIQKNNYKSEKFLEQREEIKLNLPKISKEKYIGITQISEGCLGECSYCITRIAKGKLFSYPKKKIIQSIKNDLQSGCKEIWLTSQDNASYGNDDKKYKLPELLNEIIKLKNNFFIRVGMMNPNNVLKILSELIEIYKNKKMFKFLHIPIQSGSNKILKSMRRKYKKEDFLKIISEFKKKFPEMHISTDVIVGFPGETERDFQETFDLIKKIKPETLNISKFWPRPGTTASRIQNQIPSKIKKQRATKIAELHKNICNKNQKKFIGTNHKVLVDKKGFEGTYLARDENYKLFAVRSKKDILGKIVDIKIEKVTPHYLIGEIARKNIKK